MPSSFQLLLRASTFAQRALPSLRLIQQAGGKLPPVLIEELLAAKPAAKLFVMYGQTEATARLSYLPPDKLLEKPGSIGKGIPGVELRVLNENGEPVPPGQRGEIYATGANVSPGYYDGSRGLRSQVHAVRACAPGTWPSWTMTDTSSSSIAETTSSSRGATASPARRSRRLPSGWSSSSRRP